MAKTGSTIQDYQISVLDRNITVTCRGDDHIELVKAAALLNKKLAEHRSNKTITFEKRLIEAALNLASDLLGMQKNISQSKGQTADY